MHKQKILKNIISHKKEKYPNSEYIAKNGFYLPSGLGLSNKNIVYICEQVKKLLN